MNETSKRSRFTPEGWHTVTPRIVVRDAERLVEFLRRVFGATGDYRPDLPSIIKMALREIEWVILGHFTALAACR